VRGRQKRRVNFARPEVYGSAESTDEGAYGSHGLFVRLDPRVPGVPAGERQKTNNIYA